jgi:hypothetical protein
MRVLYVVSLLFVTISCHAADLWTARASEDSPGLHLVLEGEIRSGDFAALEALLRNKGPYVETLVLYSPGGDVREAMRIGQLIRVLQVATRGPSPYYPPGARDDTPVPQCTSPTPKSQSNCVCASSCFLLWVAGVNRRESHIGIHRPAYDRRLYASLTAEKAETVYGAALKAMDAYLNAYSVPQDLRERMRSTPSRDIYQFVTPRSMTGFIPAYDELINARCGLLTQEEEGRYWKLHFKVKQKRAGDDEILEYEDLRQRYNETMTCQAFEAITMRVDAFSKYYGVDYAARIRGKR